MAEPGTDLESCVRAFGEPYRALIVDALRFLDEREHLWKLEGPIDRHAYLAELIAHAHPPSQGES
jgi:hypothetical protein